MSSRFSGWNFPLGNSIGLMLLIAIVLGGWLAAQPGETKSDRTVWCFAPSHASLLRDPIDGHPSLIEQYFSRTHQRVRIDLISDAALDARLVSMFMSQTHGAALPDLAEIEVDSAGQFLRPPADEIGFLPLNDFLSKTGWLAKLSPGRLALWSEQGRIFGVPLDVHPVTLTLRRDLFEPTGVDPMAARSWEQFAEDCRAYQRYWQAHGHPERMALDLPISRADVLSVLLLQRGINVIDAANGVHLSDPVVADTLDRYAQWCAGPDAIGEDVGNSPATEMPAFAAGNVAILFTPDWRIADVRQGAPSLAGKLEMRSLPTFEPGDPLTSSWGGTMVGIPRECADPQAAWQLLEFLYLSPAALDARAAQPTLILPAVTTDWTRPSDHRPDPFFAGQSIGDLYVRFAGRMPTRIVTPYSALGGGELATVLFRAVRWVEQQGDAGLRESTERWLSAAQADLARQISFGNGAS